MERNAFYIRDVKRDCAGICESFSELFYLKHQKNPKDDTFFFNTTSFLVIASKNPLDGGLAAANIENMAVAEGKRRALQWIYDASD